MLEGEKRELVRIVERVRGGVVGGEELRDRILGLERKIGEGGCEMGEVRKVNAELEMDLKGKEKDLEALKAELDMKDKELEGILKLISPPRQEREFTPKSKEP